MSSPEDLLRVAKALSHPLRLKILLHLARRPTYIQDIAQTLGIPYALAHMHLKVLEEAGLVEGTYVVEEKPKPHLRKIYRLRDFKLVVDRQVLEELAKSQDSQRGQ